MAKTTEPKAKEHESRKQKEVEDKTDSKTTKKPVKEQSIDNSQVPDTAEPQIQAAKAGKRSTKALKEAEEKQAKESRKSAASGQIEEEKPKAASHKATRSRLERRSKGYRKAAELVDKTKEYNLKEALTLAVKTSSVKFDATVEMHFNLGVDPRQADQNVRDTVVLPAGTGKTARIAVLADVGDEAAAKKAGADRVSSEELFAALEKGVIDFDTLIATPSMMPKLGKYARLLGPRGLMPNPKSGTVTTNVAKAIAEAKAGKVEYRVDSTGIVHLGIGKVSFGADKLEQNAVAVLTSIRAAKPANLKGVYIKSAFVTSTMGPSIRMSIAG